MRDLKPMSASSLPRIAWTTPPRTADGFVTTNSHHSFHCTLNSGEFNSLGMQEADDVWAHDLGLDEPWSDVVGSNVVFALGES